MTKYRFYHFSDLDEEEFNEEDDANASKIVWIDENWAEADSIEAIATYFLVNEDEVLEFPELKIMEE